MKKRKNLARILCFSLCFSVLDLFAKEKVKKPVVWNASKVSVLIKRTVRKDLEKILREFVQSGKPNRFIGSSGHADSLNFLQQKIRELDSESQGSLSLQSFTPDIESAIKLYQKDFETEVVGKFKKDSADYKKWDLFTKDMIKNLQKNKNTKGVNLVWEKKGKDFPQEVLVIGAHYDNILFNKKNLTVLPEARGLGANDNGSGVAILLALIPFLAEVELPRTIRVVFFDFEEMGFLGSRAFVENFKAELKKEKLTFLGMINLEMLGHDSEALDKEHKYGNMKAYIRKAGESGHEEDRLLAEELLALGKKSSGAVRFALDANSFNVSDHLAFWEAGLPALTFSQNWESDFNENGYHTESDLVEAVNISTLTHSFHFIGGATLGRLLGLKP